MKMRLWIALLMVGWFVTVHSEPSLTQTAPSQDASDKKQEALPTSDAELLPMREQVDTQIKDAQDALKAWTSILSRLQRSKSAVATIQQPDQEAFTRASTLLRNRDFKKAAAEIEGVAFTFQTLFDSACPTYSASSSSDMQSDASQLQSQCLRDVRVVEEKTLGAPNLAFLGPLYKTPSPTQNDISQDDITAASTALGAAKFQEIRKDLDSRLDKFILDATTQQQQTQSNLDALQKKHDKIAAQLAKSKTEINQLAIELGLPLFCATVLFMLCIPIVVQSFSRNQDSDKQIQAIFASGILVEIITVLLLTMTVLILGLAGKIQGEVLGTLLGGISGYVLNRVRGKSQAAADTPMSHEASSPTSTPATS